MSSVPTLRHERTLLRSGYPTLACLDEVGRGALCGPVTIGAVLISLDTPTAPRGVKDSKLVAEPLREKLAPKIRRWALGWGVGHATSQEIDEWGMTAALRLAAQRALSQLPELPAAVLLDGHHDYVSPAAQGDLFGPPTVLAEVPPVVTRIRADLHCAGVAAASILAKTERDRIVTELATEFPHYGWAHNKGYSAPQHVAALAEHGPCRHHRLSWSLPGVAAAQLPSQPAPEAAQINHTDAPMPVRLALSGAVGASSDTSGARA